MTNTPFSKRVEILNDIYMEQWDKYEGLIEQYDLGIPLAVLIMHGCATPTDLGVQQIDAAFSALCDMLEVDPYGEYDSIDEMDSISEQG